jgi:hypothetical protein
MKYLHLTAAVNKIDDQKGRQENSGYAIPISINYINRKAEFVEFSRKAAADFY